MKQPAHARGIPDERDRKEHDRAERERDDGDVEWAEALKECAEIDVAQGGQAHEREGGNEAGRLAVSVA